MWSAILTDIKSKLVDAELAKTVGIGYETGLSPDDFPAIRLVPSEIKEGNAERTLKLIVYIGMDKLESDTYDEGSGVENVTLGLMDKAEAVEKAIQYGQGYFAAFAGLVTDEDRRQGYKLFALMMNVTARYPNI
ncbi:hypothetical protein [Caudoviricetes sp.]|nr:hypothetical protein [Caudoviricetes sp.]